jgi:hypothetical protein
MTYIVQHVESADSVHSTPVLRQVQTNRRLFSCHGGLLSRYMKRLAVSGISEITSDYCESTSMVNRHNRSDSEACIEFVGGWYDLASESTESTSFEMVIYKCLSLIHRHCVTDTR